MIRPERSTVASVLAWSQTLHVNNREAATLLAHAAGRPRSWVYAYPEAELTPQHAETARDLIQRRAEEVPLAYLLGVREFWSLELLVSPAVLIPRLETETLVQAVLDRISNLPSPRIADLGTGSGAIILALGTERPDARLFATDQSSQALTVARSNAQRHGVEVDFRLGNWLQPLAGEKLDVIVSNPPYIEPDDPHLSEGDLRFEPQDALVATEGGLAAYRAVIPGTLEHLCPGGVVALEHGASQRASVIGMLEASGYNNVEVLDDDFGNPRVVCARR